MRKNLLVVLAVLLLTTSITPSSATIIVPSPASSLPVEPDPATVKAAVNEFKSLSKKERKARIKAAKNEIKAYKATKKSGKEPSTNTVLLVILAILLPPLAVYLHQGEINGKFWLSVLLTLLFWLPGVIYALILILGDEN